MNQPTLALALALTLVVTLAAAAPRIATSADNTVAPPVAPAPAAAPVTAATPAPAPAPAPVLVNPKKSVADAGNQPYAIRVWLVVDPGARLDGPGRSALLGSWQGLVRRFVGPPWQLEIAEGPGPLLGGNLEGVAAETVAVAAPGFDKGWLIQIAADTADGFVLTGREYDAATLRLGEVVRRRVTYPCDVARGLLDLAFSMFCPVAEIGDKEDGLVKVIVRGAGLPAADPIGRVIVPGSTFRLIRLNYTDSSRKTIARTKATSAPLIKDIPHSFLRVESIDGPLAYCSIVSGVRDPLTKKAINSRVVALGIKPTSVASRYRFVIPPERPKVPTERREIAPPRPAPGYVLTFRDVPNGTPRPLGITDRDGRITLEPAYSNQLVILRLQAGGSEPVVEFPAMPGESDREQMIPIQAKPEAVALQTAVNAIRDELVDLVGIRGRLEIRIKTRVEGERWDEVRELIPQYRKLPNRKVFETRLKALQDRATLDQRELKRPVLTRTAQALIADAQALVDRYLLDTAIEGFEESLNDHDHPPKPVVAASPTPVPAPAPAPTSVASAAMPGAPGIAMPPTGTSPGSATSGLTDYTPPDGAYTIGLPGPPNAMSQTMTQNNISVNVNFVLGIGSDKTIGGIFHCEMPTEILPSGQDTLIQSMVKGAMDKTPGARMVGQRDITFGALKGRELEMSTPPDAVTPGGGVILVRALFQGKRAFVMLLGGSKERVHSPYAETFFSSFRPKAL